MYILHNTDYNHFNLVNLQHATITTIHTTLTQTIFLMEQSDQQDFRETISVMPIAHQINLPGVRRRESWIFLALFLPLSDHIN